jgi:hypothetical protein
MAARQKQEAMRACQATTQKTHRAIRLTALELLAGPKKPAKPDCVAKHGLHLIASASDPE